MHQNRGINRTFVPIIVRVGLTLPVFPSVYYQHRIIRHTTPGQNRYAMTFQELNLIEPLKRAVAEKGYTTPTPIQQQAIPPALEGRDLMGCAQTGTGKTAAFTLPILQLLAAEPRTKGRRTIKALVLTPTRELPLVINYDLPEVPETYVHRIGRTGRAGRDGQAIAFCSEEERPLLKDILKLTGLELDPDSGELAPAQNSRKKPAGKKPDTAQTGGQKQAEEKRAAQKQPAQSQAGQRPGRRKPQGQAPGDPKPQGQRTGGKQTPDGQQPQDKDAAARPARRRNRNRGRQKPDRQNAAAANTERRQDDRKSGSQKPARDKRETGSPEAPRKTQAPEKKKSGMGSWLSGILRPGRK